MDSAIACEKCLNELASRDQESKGKPNIQCPQCRQTTKMKNWRRNYDREEWLQHSVMQARARCKQHYNMEKYYFCTTCRQALCPECRFSEEHLGHKTTRLSDEFSEAVKRVKS